MLVPLPMYPNGGGRNCDARRLALCDRPHYHTIDAFAAAARAAHHAGFTRLRIWGHDHDGAYRQCALSDPEVAYFVLPTRHGPLLFKHSVLMFGAKGAVWGYGRLGDAIVHISRCLLATPSLHFMKRGWRLPCK